MAHDDSKRDHSEADEPVRQGDILGLGGIAVPKSSTDPTTEFDESSEAHRHARALREAEESGASDTAYRRSSGATGIDMGAGGSGTDIE
jgi:hypothetical protein